MADLGAPAIPRGSSRVWSGGWIRTWCRRRSAGPGIRLPGRLTAAAPQASASARASVPSAPAARNPARSASPAPTELRGRSTGESPLTKPPLSTSTAPSAPRLASTASAPHERRRLAGLDDIGQRAQGDSDHFGQLFPVGFEQGHSGLRRRPEPWAAGVDGHAYTRLDQCLAQEREGRFGQAGRKASACDDPVGVRRRSAAPPP